jgi:hypothetical protein
MDRHIRPTKAFRQCRTNNQLRWKLHGQAEYAFNEFFIQQRHLAGMWRGTSAYRYQWARWWALSDGLLLTASTRISCRRKELARHGTKVEQSQAGNLLQPAAVPVHI